VERILSELEEFYETSNLAKAEMEKSDEQHWMKLSDAESFLIATLGYDDEDEFQDAMGGTMIAFLEGIPTCEIKNSEEGEPLFRFLRRDPKDPQILRLHITKREQLWYTLLKDQESTLEIPEIEFGSGHSLKRQIESVYNFIANSIANLEVHVQNLTKQTGADGAEIVSVSEQIDELKACLDLDRPFTILIRDPRGLSEFKPDNEVIVEPYEEAKN